MIVIMPCVTEYCKEILGPRTTPNEKVDQERGVAYTSSAAEEEFARDY